MKILSYDVFTDAEMNADILSSIIDIRGCYGFFTQWVYSGSPSGSIIIQGSVDGLTYFDIATETIGTGKGFKSIDAAYFAYLKIFFDRTTGTASDKITCKVFAKGI